MQTAVDRFRRARHDAALDQRHAAVVDQPRVHAEIVLVRKRRENRRGNCADAGLNAVAVAHQCGDVFGNPVCGRIGCTATERRQRTPRTDERIEALRSFVETSMKTLDVPGAGFALIDQGRIVYEGGIGVKQLGKPDLVDANTLFMAAFNTKGMTTLLLAKLVDEKKLQWEEPVTKVYPKFKLADETITLQIEIRHLICACTGMPRQDFEWLFEYKKFKPDSTFTLLSSMRPTSKFGEVFQYSNLMASAAGYIGGHVYEPAGEPGAVYDRAMENQIFKPLGMKNTTFDMEKAQHGDLASPHSDNIDGLTKLLKMDQNYSVVPFRPAGGVWTSAHDMTQYASWSSGAANSPMAANLFRRRIC